MKRIASIIAMLLAAGSGTAFGGPISFGNLLVFRVDNDGRALSNAASRVFIDEYKMDGTLVQSFEMPSGDAGTRLTASGTATSEGKFSVSPNGQWVALVGYDRAFGEAGTAVGELNRTIARISTADGTVDVSTSGTLGGNSNTRGVTVDNTGTNFWAVLNGATSTAETGRGIRYITLGQTTVGPQLANNNLRGASIYDDQLYTFGAASGSYGVLEVGEGLPTTADQTLTGLPGIGNTDAASGNPLSGIATYGFFMADLNPSVTGYDTLWMARDGEGVTKFSLVDGSWITNNTLSAGAAALHISGMQTESGVLLAVATAGSIQILLDETGYNASMTGTFQELATPEGDNNAFRGVAFVIPEPATFGLLAGFGLLLAVRRRFR